MNKMRSIPFIGLLLFLAACSSARLPAASIDPAVQNSIETATRPSVTTEIHPTVTIKPTENSNLDPINQASPSNKRADEDVEYILPQQLIPFDGIMPVYTPDFVTAEGAPLQEDELVMGIVIGGEAKAYPVSVLRFREMVDDELAGWPILVTW
jgi:hypothetical protein